MTDLLERLAGLDSAAPTPSDLTVAADLERGRRAVAHRRRHRATVAGAGLGVMAVIGLGSVALSERAPTPPPVDLVAYSGEQPDGFEVARIPAGFVAQGTNPHFFTIARAVDTSSPQDFRDKLVVMVESGLAAPGRLAGEPVSVNGHPGAIRHTGDGLTLEFHDGSHEVVVQMAASVGLSTAELVDFAEGVTVTADAAREELAPGAADRRVVRDGDGWRVEPRTP